MLVSLPSGLRVNPLGRCAASFCQEPAELIATFIRDHSQASDAPVGYCADHVEKSFVDDETYRARHRDYPVGVGPVIFPRSMYEIREPNEVEAAELAYARDAELRWHAEGRIGEYRRIAELHAAAEIDGMLVDVWTAGACVALHDALSETNRARWLALPTMHQCAVAVHLTMGGSR